MLATKEQKPTPQSAEHPSGDARYKIVDRALKRLRYQQDALIEVLHVAQEAFGFLDEGLLIYIARQLKLPPSWVFGVATFYHFFSFDPKGDYTCTVCMGTACYVKGATEIVAALEKEFGIKAGETTPDKKFTLVEARCLGSCGLAPILLLNGEVLGKETPESTLAKIKALMKGAPAKNNGHATPDKEA
jgi:bidirectional [NiFe] hydrogenase diaphorase subunit